MIRQTEKKNYSSFLTEGKESEVFRYFNDTLHRVLPRGPVKLKGVRSHINTNPFCLIN